MSPVFGLTSDPRLTSFWYPFLQAFRLLFSQLCDVSYHFSSLSAFLFLIYMIKLYNLWKQIHKAK